MYIKSQNLEAITTEVISDFNSKDNYWIQLNSLYHKFLFSGKFDFSSIIFINIESL